MASSHLARRNTYIDTPTRRSSDTCDTCRLRPKYVEGDKTHSYCSKSCAARAEDKARSKRALEEPANMKYSDATLCDFCRRRPRKADRLFCSKECSDNWKSYNRPTRRSSDLVTIKQNTCSIPGCSKPQMVTTPGMSSKFCSAAHQRLAETACLMCRLVAKGTKSHFCTQICSDRAERKGPMLLEIPAGHDTFKDVAHQFKVSWRHAATVPHVRRVYKIVSSPSSLAKYNAYRAAVEARGKFASQSNMTAGNENRRWHGTRRECSLGDPGITTFCHYSTCSLCSIIRTSFDLNLFGNRKSGKKCGWGRFGRGIYTSSTSSKSNDYSQNTIQSPLKATLLNKVIVGRGCKMTQNNTSLTSPPPGYDSVLGEKGDTLNYDELVVYTNDAIRPSYLIMFDA